MGGTGSDVRSSSRFPLLLGLGCGILAVALFFSGTVPALRENDDLREAQDTRTDLLDALIRETAELRQHRVALDHDPQTVLVEIDALGLTPDELLERRRLEAPSDH